VEDARDDDADAETDGGRHADGGVVVEHVPLESQGDDVEERGEDRPLGLDDGGVLHETEVGVGRLDDAGEFPREVVGEPVEEVVDGDVGDEVDDEGDGGDDGGLLERPAGAEFLGEFVVDSPVEAVFLEEVHDAHGDGERERPRDEDVDVHVDDAPAVPAHEPGHAGKSRGGRGNGERATGIGRLRVSME